MILFDRIKELEKEEILKKCFQKGENLSQELKLGERISKINNYGNKNPEKVFTWIFISIICAFGIGLLYPKNNNRNKIEITNNDSLIIKEKKLKDDINHEMKEIYKEFELLSDTVTILMKMDKLSKEDSIVLVKKFVRLEAIDKVLNEKYNIE